MNQVKIIAVGDNVMDKFISRGLMYPGGQCVNTCAYAIMNGAKAAYLGKYGSDDLAAYNRKILKELGIDDSRSRQFEGENGYARVTLRNNDRVFLGSNKGGVAKDHPFDFNADDIAYIKGFDVIYTNLNSYIENDLPLLASTGIPVVYDFSTRWTDDYLKKVCPHIQMATMSCAHLSDAERETEMRKAADLGIKIVLGTKGPAGSYALYDGKFYFQEAFPDQDVKDTMGAGDSYFAAFLVNFFGMSEKGDLYGGDMEAKLKTSMRAGSAFAVKCCGMEGAFGYGIPITGEAVKLDIFENNDEGIKCVYKNDKWLVSIKNWKPDNDIEGIVRLEVHHSTDEQFILTHGKAMLIAADLNDDKFDIDVVPMEIGKVYNVPKERWFYSITQKDTKMMYVQDSNCSMENSEYRNLSKDEITFIQQKAKEYFGSK